MRCGPPAPAFRAWSRSLGLSDDLTKRFWRACHRGNDSRVAALLFSLQHVLDAPSDDVMRARCRAFSFGPGRPEVLVDLLEYFVKRGWLARATASQMQTIILQSVDHRGAWKW